MMYDQMIDGDYFNYDLSTAEDLTRDACCLKAAEDDDLQTAQGACTSCETTEDDEFFTFDSPVCTRRFDRTIDCFSFSTLSGEDPNLPDYTNIEHCIEEILPASACCEAKQQGKMGSGLDQACATFTYPTEEPITPDFSAFEM